MTETTETDQLLDFLGMRDWVAKQPVTPSGWVVVAQSIRKGDEDYYTTSVLLKPGDDVSILESAEWDVDNSFGMPYFWTRGAETTAHYDPGENKQKDDRTFVPFTIRRNGNGLAEARFELRQEFLLYHDAYFVRETGEYRRLDHDGHEIVVAKTQENHEGLLIVCEEHELRDYLAARASALVRYHDHRRFSREDASEIVASKRNMIKYTADVATYSVTISDSGISENKSFSRLLGKDIIRPYDQPAAYHTDWVDLTDKKKYVSFIIGRDKDGNEIESTCDTNTSGSADVLTNVFFDRRVLQKYANEPRRFNVTPLYLGCLSQWGVPIDINPAGLVHAYLGDLARIPYAEQLHWRAHNVVGKGGVSRERFQRDFMVQPADPVGDPAWTFRRAYMRFQKLATGAWGEPVFKPLHPEDTHVLRGIHVPFTEEQLELDELIRRLATLLPDSLDVKVLENNVGTRIQENRRIAHLKTLLEKIGIPAEQREPFIRALQAVQALRSKGAAHRKGDDWAKALRTFGFEGRTPEQIIMSLLRDLTAGLDALNHLLRPETDRGDR